MTALLDTVRLPIISKTETLLTVGARALYMGARLAGRFHRFEDANAVLSRALAGGYPQHEIDLERVALLQATGRYQDALVLRERLAKDDPWIHSLGVLASLLAITTSTTL
jgi:hypothetical protein